MSSLHSTISLADARRIIDKFVAAAHTFDVAYPVAVIDAEDAGWLSVSGRLRSSVPFAEMVLPPRPAIIVALASRIRRGFDEQ